MNKIKVNRIDLSMNSTDLFVKLNLNKVAWKVRITGLLGQQSDVH